MDDILFWTIRVCIAIHAIVIAGCIWRVWRGENIIDRLIAVDLFGILVLAVLVLLSIAYETTFYVDVALGLAALGFVGTVLLAKYIADERMF